ncbi:2-oxoacid:ferredoxin oxidoreductase subunit beta [Streptomyces hirsutus]
MTPENEAEIVVHDAHSASPTTAFALSRLADPDTLRHRRSVSSAPWTVRSTTLMAEQLDTAVEQHGKGELGALLAGADTWTVVG